MAYDSYRPDYDSRRTSTSDDKQTSDSRHGSRPTGPSRGRSEHSVGLNDPPAPSIQRNKVWRAEDIQNVTRKASQHERDEVPGKTPDPRFTRPVRSPVSTSTAKPHGPSDLLIANSSTNSAHVADTSVGQHTGNTNSNPGLQLLRQLMDERLLKHDLDSEQSSLQAATEKERCDPSLPRHAANSRDPW